MKPVKKRLVFAVLSVSLLSLSSFICRFPNDTLLLWLDVYIPPLPDGNIYLDSDYLDGITNVGARIAGITFSPDDELLWYLVETHVTQITSLAHLSMVRKTSLAMKGPWKWWNKNWRDQTRIDPLLSMMAERVRKESPNSRVPVIIHSAGDGGGFAGEIKALVKSLHGEVVRIGLAGYVLAEMPPATLTRLLENRHVGTLEADRPISLREM
jgi:hypothetical protein